MAFDESYTLKLVYNLLKSAIIDGTMQASVAAPINVTVFASQVRNAAATSSDIASTGAYKGCIASLNIVDLFAAQTLQVFIDGKDELSGVYYPLAQTTALAVEGVLTNLFLYPGANNTLSLTNLIVSGLPISKTMRIRLVPSSANNYTCSVGLVWIN